MSTLSMIGSSNMSVSGDMYKEGIVQTYKPMKKCMAPSELLHLTVWEGKVAEMKKLVVERGVSVESFNSLGQTPLFVACYIRNYSAVRTLLKLGANPNFRCVPGYTPTHAACFSGSRKILGKILECSGDLRLHDENRMTPIDWAFEQPEGEKRIRVLELIESARRCTMKQTGKETLQEKSFTRNIGGRSSLTQLLKKKLPVKGGENGKQEVDMGELVKNIHAMGFGKLYFGNGLKAAAISTVPYIDAQDLHADRHHPTYRSGSFTQMTSKLWLHTRVTVRSLLDPPPTGAIVDILISELEALCKLTHPQFLLLMGVCQTQNYEGLMLVFEHVQLGSLYYCLHEKNCMPKLKSAVDILLQIVDAVIYLHSHGWLHCSLTSHAVHLVGPNVAKLSSFEFAIEDTEEARAHRTYELLANKGWQSLYNWLCPDVLNGEPPSKQGDIYGLCCLVWELCTGQVPWGNLDPDDIVIEILTKKHMLPLDCKYLPRHLFSLLEQGLQLRAADRDVDLQEIRDMLILTRRDIVRSEKKINNNTSLPLKDSSTTDSGVWLGPGKPVRSYSSSAIQRSHNDEDAKPNPIVDAYTGLRKTSSILKRKDFTEDFKEFQRSSPESFISQQNLDDYSYVKNKAKREFLRTSSGVRAVSRRSFSSLYHDNLIAESAGLDLSCSSSNGDSTTSSLSEDCFSLSSNNINEERKTRTTSPDGSRYTRSKSVPRGTNSAAAFVAAHLQEANKHGYGRTFSNINQKLRHERFATGSLSVGCLRQSSKSSQFATSSDPNNDIKPASHAIQRNSISPAKVSSPKSSPSISRLNQHVPIPANKERDKLLSSSPQPVPPPPPEVKTAFSKVREIYRPISAAIARTSSLKFKNSSGNYAEKKKQDPPPNRSNNNNNIIDSKFGAAELNRNKTSLKSGIFSKSSSNVESQNKKSTKFDLGLLNKLRNCDPPKAEPHPQEPILQNHNGIETLNRPTIVSSSSHHPSKPQNEVPMDVELLLQRSRKLESHKSDTALLTSAKPLFESQPKKVEERPITRKIETDLLNPLRLAETDFQGTLHRLKPQKPGGSSLLNHQAVYVQARHMQRQRSFKGTYASIWGRKPEGEVVKAADRLSSPPRSEWSTKGVQNLIQTLESRAQLLQKNHENNSCNLYNTAPSHFLESSGFHFSTPKNSFFVSEMGGKVEQKNEVDDSKSAVNSNNTNNATEWLSVDQGNLNDDKNSNNDDKKNQEDNDQEQDQWQNQGNANQWLNQGNTEENHGNSDQWLNQKNIEDDQWQNQGNANQWINGGNNNKEWQESTQIEEWQTQECTQEQQESVENPQEYDNWQSQGESRWLQKSAENQEENQWLNNNNNNNIQEDEFQFQGECRWLNNNNNNNQEIEEKGESEVDNNFVPDKTSPKQENVIQKAPVPTPRQSPNKSCFISGDPKIRHDYVLKRNPLKTSTPNEQDRFYPRKIKNLQASYAKAMEDAVDEYYDHDDDDDDDDDDEEEDDDSEHWNTATESEIRDEEDKVWATGGVRSPSMVQNAENMWRKKSSLKQNPSNQHRHNLVQEENYKKEQQNVTFNSEVLEISDSSRGVSTQTSDADNWSRRTSAASSYVGQQETEDLYCDDELHPSLENDPNMQLFISQNVDDNENDDGTNYPSHPMFADRDSILSMDIPSTGPTSLRSEISEDKETFNTVSSEDLSVGDNSALICSSTPTNDQNEVPSEDYNSIDDMNESTRKVQNLNGGYALTTSAQVEMEMEITSQNNFKTLDDCARPINDNDLEFSHG